MVFRCAISGHTSRQYFVQATSEDNLPKSRSITVALGCNETTRFGV